MPRVPAYERSVRLRPVHQQNMNITATADHMGAAVGRGMKSLAGGIDKVGEAVHETHVQSLKDLAVQTEADEATTRFRPINSKALHDPETGVLKRTGKAAVDSRAAYEKDITAQKDAIAKGLSPEARKIFNAAAMSEIATSLETVIPHSVREVKRWVNEASAASVASFIGEAALSFAVPGSLPRLAGALAQEIARNGRLNGLNEAEIGQQQRVRTSQLHTTALLEQAKSDPLGAKATFDELGETLSQEDRSHLEEKLREPVLNAQASEKGREIMGLRRRLVTAAARTPQEGTPPSGTPAPKAFLRQTYKGASRYDGIDTLDDSFAGNLAALMEDAPASMRGRLGLIKVSARPAEGERQTVDLVYNGRSLGLAPQEVRDYILANASRYNLSFPAPGPSPEAAGYGALRPVEFGSRLVARGSGLSQRATLPSAAEIDTHLASIPDPALRERTRRLVSQSIDAESRAAQERHEAETRERYGRISGASSEMALSAADLLLMDDGERIGRRERTSDPFLKVALLDLAARHPDGFSGINLTDHYAKLSRADGEHMEAIQQAVISNDPKIQRLLSDWAYVTEIMTSQLTNMGLMPEDSRSQDGRHQGPAAIAGLQAELYSRLRQADMAGHLLDEAAKRGITTEAIAPLVQRARQSKSQQTASETGFDDVNVDLVQAKPISSVETRNDTLSNTGHKSDLPLANGTPNTELKRREFAVINDMPYRISIEDGEDGKKDPPFYRKMLRVPYYGVKVINELEPLISKYSKIYEVDDNIIKAIFFIENSQGWYDDLKTVGHKLGVLEEPTSTRPANINAHIWRELMPGRDMRKDIDANVEGGVKLISRIMERLDDPSVAKIATLYNGLSQTSVSIFGRQVNGVYNERPWDKLSSRRSF